MNDLAALGQQGRLYFAYGSNMDPEQMAQRVPSARFAGLAVLPEYRLAFPVRSSGAYAGAFVAGVVPAPGQEVWGVLYLMDEAGLATLDHYERAYTREIEMVRGPGDVPVRAVTYLHKEDGSGGGAPAARYLAKLIRGAEAHGLPAWYQDRLAAIVPCDE